MVVDHDDDAVVPRFYSESSIETETDDEANNYGNNNIDDQDQDLNLF